MGHMGSVLFRDTMVPIIEKDSILLLGYSTLYKEYNLIQFNHQKTPLVWSLLEDSPKSPELLRLGTPMPSRLGVIRSKRLCS